MASSPEVLADVLERAGRDPRITHRKMMGEYLLYVNGKLFGGIYDDRLLVKDHPSVRPLLAATAGIAPYDGAKPMLPVSGDDDLRQIVSVLERTLPPPKKKA